MTRRMTREGARLTGLFILTAAVGLGLGIYSADRGDAAGAAADPDQGIALILDHADWTLGTEGHDALD